MDANLDDFYTSEHKRLDWIARAATIFASVILVFFALNAFSYFWVNIGSGGWAIGWLIKSNPRMSIQIGINILFMLMQGVIYWLVLKGISLGLNIIIETDLNYRDRLPSETDER